MNWTNYQAAVIFRISKKLFIQICLDNYDYAHLVTQIKYFTLFLHMQYSRLKMHDMKTN